MRILYVGHTRFPTEKAHGHQIAQVCSAIASLGHDVTLVTPTVWTPITQSPHDYYGVLKNFQWKQLPSFDALHTWFVPQPLAFFFSMRSYRAALRMLLKTCSVDLLYCRSHFVLEPMLETGKPVIIELHRLPKGQRQKFVQLINKCARVACLTSPMRDKLISWGVDAKHLVVEGDAVNLDRFVHLSESHTAKDTFHLPHDRIVIGYVGQLKTMDMEKGVLVLLQAIAKLKERGSNVFGFIVGGPKQEQQYYQEQAAALRLTQDDVRFTGQISASDVPQALAACDILAMPFPNFLHYRENMSPLKMFEYMATGKPIITSDLPTIRDVLSEETAFFCEPSNVESLVHVLQKVIADPDEAHRRAESACRLVEDYTWQKRMGRVLDGILTQQ